MCICFTVPPPSLLGPVLLGQPFFGNIVSAYCVSHLPVMYMLIYNATNLLLQVNIKLSYIADSGEVRTDTLDSEPISVNRSNSQNNFTISLPPIAGVINVTCVSRLRPADMNTRFISSDQVESNLHINPTGENIVM